MRLTDELSNKMANMSVVCAFMVVFMHTGNADVVESSGWWWTTVVRQFCKIAVPWFFLASGFFLVGHYESDPNWYRTALVKRVRTLLIPYVVWCLVRCAYFIPICARKCDLSDFLARNFWTFLGLDLLHAPFSSVMWYVRSLIFFVLLSPILLICLRRMKGWLPLLLWGIDAAFRLRPAVFGETVQGFFWFVFSLEGAAWFCLGMGLRTGIVIPRKIPFGAGVLWGAAAVLIGGCSVAYALGVAMLSFEGFVIPFVMGALWLSVPAAAWPKCLTKATFPIYVLHPFVMTILIGLVFRDSNSALQMTARAVVAAIGAWGGALFMLRFMPRTSSLIFGGRS